MRLKAYYVVKTTLRGLRKIGKGLYVSIFLPLVAGIYILAPVLLVRIGAIRSDRIGSLGLDLELSIWHDYEMIKVKRFPKRIDLFFTSKPVSNEYLLNLWRVRLKILPRWLLFPLDTIIKKFSCLNRHDYFNFISTFGHSDLTFLDRHPPYLQIPPEDKARGEKILDELGLKPGQPFVCLAVRDNLYLKDHIPKKDWSYHDYRDSSIEDYKDMAEFLASRGIAVLRMGKRMRGVLNSKNPLIIDYSNSKFKSDFADVYLFSNCFFCISTSTGMDALASIFRKPIGLVNIVNIVSVANGQIVKLFQPKSFFDLNLKRNLNYDEIAKRGLFSFTDSNEFISSGIELKDNSPNELTLFARDFLEILTEIKVNVKDDTSYINYNSFGFPKDKIAQSWLHHHVEYVKSNIL
jgi:putative glycosyltransferase (TIGR04372 family)